jgi:hypothetical protein
MAIAEKITTQQKLLNTLLLTFTKTQKNLTHSFRYLENNNCCENKNIEKKQPQISGREHLLIRSSTHHLR